ncbi:MAG: hypothetical protein QOI42_268 [Frankiaceae bacterium]|nr:hypothetical protein [Frankiaceae bacterium]
MKIVTPRLAAAAVTAVVAAAALSSPAFAAKRTASHTFTLHGIVVGKSAGHVRVLTRSARINGKSVSPRVVTLTVTAASRRHVTGLVARAATTDPTATIPVGSDITATGTTTGGLTVATAVVKPVPAEAIYGQVLSVNGTLVTLAGRDEARGNGEEGNGDHGNRDERNILDLSAATISGSATTIATIKPGQFLVALGENSSSVMAVADVAVFDSAPQVLIGKVATADPATHTLTVTVHDRRHDGRDGSDDTSGQPTATATPTASTTPTASATPSPTATAHHDGEQADGDSSDGELPGSVVTVDATSADIVVNGNAPAGSTTPAFPSVGDHVLVLAPETTVTTPAQPGTPSAPVAIAATLVYDFNSADRGPVGQNDDRDDDHGGND